MFCIEVHLHSPFLCSAAPLALSCEFTGRHSHTDECVSVKRAGMAVTSLGTVEKQTNPPPQPSAPLRKLAQAPPIGHKHYRVRSTNSLKKAKHSAFHAESPAWPTLASTDKHKSGKVQSKWHTLGLTDVAYCCILSKKCKKWMNPPQTGCPAMPAQVLNAASAQQCGSSIHLALWIMCHYYETFPGRQTLYFLLQQPTALSSKHNFPIKD